MKKKRLNLLFLGLLGWTTGCFQGDNTPNTSIETNAAGTGDAHEAREVSGVWLLSTDYNYDERCNYMQVDYVRNLFKLDESLALEKYDLPNGCEVRWKGQKVGFYFEEGSPYESTWQSEYAFDNLFQPRRVAEQDSATVTPGVKDGSYHGPNPGGTGAERPVEGVSTGGGIDASARNDSSNQPTPTETAAGNRLTDPAESTPTGIAVNEVGDKAIWDPKKRTLHVLHINHILHISAPTNGNDQVARQGAIDLAKAIIGRLFDTSS